MNTNKRRKLTPYQKQVRNSNIPNFVSDPVISYVGRWYNDTTSIQTITSELPIVPWVVAATASAAYCPCKSIAISRINIWCPYTSGDKATLNTITLQTTNEDGEKPVQIAATATYNSNAYITWKPPATSTLSWFYPNRTGTNPSVVFQLPPTGTIEIKFKMILSDGSSILVSGGFTVGLTYAGHLGTYVLPIGKEYSENYAY
jgi:hypothetical protein